MHQGPDTIRDPTEKTPERVIMDAILRKIEANLRVIDPVRQTVLMVGSMVRTVLSFIPFAYREFQAIFHELERDLATKGTPYRFNPDQLIFTTLQLLIAEGEFTEEELAFIKKCPIRLKRLILEKELRASCTDDAVPEDRKNLPTSASLYRKISDAVGFSDRPRSESEREEEQPDEDKLRWDRDANEFMFYNLDLVKLMKMPPYELARKFAMPKVFPEGDLDKLITYYKRIFNIPGTSGKIKKVVRDYIVPHEERLLAEANEQYKEILWYFYDDEDDIRTHEFPPEVANCTNVLQLFNILNRIFNINVKYHTLQTIPRQDRKKAEESLRRELHVVNCARIKLAIYFASSTISQMVPYQRRDSVEEYFNEYLKKEIFKIEKTVTLQIPNTDPPLEVEVLKGDLIDPDTGETVRVYLYRPDTGASVKRKSAERNHDRDKETDVVNRKKKAKIIAKHLLEGGVKDIFRITVMPVDSNLENLRQVRRILKKTIDHPASTHPSSMKKEGDDHNRASAYHGRRVRKDDQMLSPWVVDDDGRLSDGYIVETTGPEEGHLIKTGPVPLETRKGLPEEILADFDPDADGNHRVFTHLRYFDLLAKFLNPELYPGNWTVHVAKRISALEVSLLDGDKMLPGLVCQRIQEIRLKSARRAGRAQIL